MSNGINLDYEAARHSQKIISRAKEEIGVKKASTVDNLVTKALGVLQENGIYACALFLKSRTRDEEKPLSNVVMDEMLNLIEILSSKLDFGWGEKPAPDKADIVLKYLSDNVLKDLAKLLMAKEALEQMLIYARYGAKARKAEEGDS